MITIKNKKMRIIKLGKRGFFDDVAELFMASIALVVLGIIMIVLFNASTAEKKDQVSKEISFLESNYDTTILLKQEIRPSYRLYELIIDVVNSGQSYTIIDNEIEKMMREHYDPQNEQSWVFQINAPGKVEHIYSHNADKIPVAAMSLIEGTFIPNPNGGNIRVIFKEVKPSDSLFESGSRDDFLT